MTQQFLADGTPALRYRFLAKLLLLIAALTLLNLWLGFPPSIIIGVAVFGLGSTMLAYVARGKWGERLELESDTIVVYARGQVRYRIRTNAIKRLVVKHDAVSLIWMEGTRREALILGKERFAPATWQALHAAFVALRERAAN